MKPRTTGEALPPGPTPGGTPPLRRAPAGTPLATPIVPLVATGTAAIPRHPAPRRGLRLLAIGIALAVIALGVTAVLYMRASRREALEAQFPVVSDGSVAATLDRETARWATGKPRLIRALARFAAPPLDSLVGAGACELAGEGLSFTAGPELVTDATAAVDELLVTGRRGRFASVAAQDAVIAQLTGPIRVVAGPVTYAFDPGTGNLVCAGTTTLRAVE